jgi:protein-S-isoprenylcysteine O-methyltransferase Ste14
MLIWVIGLALFTANIGFMLFALLTAILLVARMPREEKMMLDQFGDEYRYYRAETGGIFPRLKRKR